MLNIDTADRREQRKFGLVMAAAFVVLGSLRWALHGFQGFPVYFCGVAVVFFVVALALPKTLQPIFVLWMKLAVVLNYVMMHLLLGIAFYLLITPAHAIMKVFSDDPLKREWQPDADSYWEPAEEQPDEFDRYRNQF